MINWILSVPLLLIFAWPYYFFCNWFGVGAYIAWPGSLLFAYPFMTTILHGHVTMALGSLHRYLFYQWLHQKPWSYGLLFHETLTRTRFRLIVLVTSISLIPVGILLRNG